MLGIILDVAKEDGVEDAFVSCPRILPRYDIHVHVQREINILNTGPNSRKVYESRSLGKRSRHDGATGSHVVDRTGKCAECMGCQYEGRLARAKSFHQTAFEARPAGCCGVSSHTSMICPLNPRGQDGIQKSLTFC